MDTPGHREFLRLKKLQEGLLGEPLRETSDFAALVAALDGGETGIIVLFPWDGRHEGEDYPYAPLVVAKREDDRIYYCHSLPRREAPAGSFLGGASGLGPPRRAEENGFESMDFATFRRGMEQGGRALVPSPPMPVSA